MTKLKDLEAAYKEQARQEQLAPPEELWSRIEASLNSAQVVKKRVLPFWWRMGAATAAAAALWVAVFLLPLGDQESYLAQEREPAAERTEAGSTARYDEQALEQGVVDPVTGTTGSESLADKTSLPQAVQGSPGATGLIRTLDQTREATIDAPQNETSLHPLNYRPSRPRFADTAPAAETLKIRSASSFKRFDVPASNVVLAALDQEETRKKRALRMGFSVSPLYSFRETTPTASAPVMMATSDRASYNEQGLLSAAGGLHLSMDLGKRWAVETGLAYARMGQEVETPVTQSRRYAASNEAAQDVKPTSFRSLSLANSLGDIHRSTDLPELQKDAPAYAEKQTMMVGMGQEVSTTSASLQQHLDYLEIPLTLRYIVIDRSTRLSLAAGLSSNWLVDNKAWLEEEGQRQQIGETEGIAAMTFSTHAGMALSVPLGGPFSLRFEPRFSYFLNEINETHTTAFKPWSFGIYSGIQYTIGD
ncbi:outer membrane beta-barrel protein [Geofilum rhodophaeum]|uniref:outer membrane beta-barrel protein n=1 Tax=Geofilum rhodophaeum TaxID=1965019 RepID=UPI001314C533|nr:outer membrane beta-barrel protein [Geofilum rhodophaeum]